ncbi:MAG: hypothetical protein J7M25_13345 [Deltaproteobacteria bacterium]|nr:hypothetical protein [Deltaproteobacteria bacterium]
MTRRSLLVAMVLSALVLGGCESNSATLLIIQNQIPGDGCSVDSSGTGAYRTQGTLDVAWYLQKNQPAYYNLYPLIQNNLMSTADPSAGTIEENCITIREARVDLDLGDLGEYVESNLTKYSVPLSMTICPGEEKVVSVRVIPSQVVELIADQISQGSSKLIIAKVHIVGSRGSHDLSSNSMSYPIFVCNGCLVKNLGLCSSDTIPSDPEEGNGCNPSQDDPIECCTQGAELVCPAVAPTTTTDGSGTGT